MPRTINNPTHIQRIVDLMANMIGFMNTIRSDCEGDLSRYKEEYIQTIDSLNARWFALCSEVLPPADSRVYVAQTSPGLTHMTHAVEPGCLAPPTVDAEYEDIDEEEQDDPEPVDEPQHSESDFTSMLSHISEQLRVLNGHYAVVTQPEQEEQ